jgi:hypothetical protein
LKIQPEFGRIAEIAAQPQRCIRGNSAPALQDRLKTGSRHAQRERQPISGKLQRRYKFPVNISPGVISGRRSERLSCLRVVIDDFDLMRISFLPYKTDSVLIVDANTVLSFPIARRSKTIVSRAA